MEWEKWRGTRGQEPGTRRNTIEHESELEEQKNKNNEQDKLLGQQQNKLDEQQSELEERKNKNEGQDEFLDDI
jgi:ribosome-interacting GTPase 1